MVGVLLSNGVFVTSLCALADDLRCAGLQIHVTPQDWAQYVMNPGLCTADGLLNLDGFQRMIIRSINVYLIGQVALAGNKVGQLGREQVWSSSLNSK